MTTTSDIFAAVQSRDPDAVRAAIARDPGGVARRNEQGVTPVIFAAYVGAPELSDILIEHGAEVDVFAAAALGKTDALSTNLAADPVLVHAFSPDGWTPLHLTAFFGRAEAARLLLARGASHAVYGKNATANQPLHAATAGGQLELATLLLDAGADVNAWGDGAYAPLHLAAGNGRLDLMELLLGRGAAINARQTEASPTPLGIAEQFNQPIAAAWLRERGGMT